MSDRLQELLRQKTLLNEQLSWLEKEIATEKARIAGNEPPSAVGPPFPPPVLVAPRPPAPALVENDAEAILGQYRQNPGEIQRDTRKEVLRGCLIYLAAGLALLALGYLAVRFYSQGRHGI
ncbi:MAG: hypothetical protein A3G75_11040 [Verrucomicrobia bacterium RIFCSPLOWO2_12_FULL_64_8]|nr:MAG: hypothetical protein A3G75_11040 [Verrucomicrobia bacterium RIFCSPLOWO2_12_FULL_64_8]